MAPTITCPGCSQSFSRRGALNNHLAKTDNPACQNVDIIPPASQPPSPTLHLQALEDFFGQYGENDLPWPSAWQSAPPISEAPLEASDGQDEEDSDDEDTSLFESNFEPFRCNDNMDIDQSDHMAAHEDVPYDRHAEDSLCTKWHVVPHPAPLAGRITQEQSDQYTNYQEHVTFGRGNIYPPFLSKLDWEVAKWAKLCGSGSTAFSDLLKIDGLVDALGLSYANSQQLNGIIDDTLPSLCPPFIAREVIINDEAYEVYFRDVLECVKALFGNPECANNLVYVLERQYVDADHTIHVYHDMHTGKWWWGTQDVIEAATPGATIIPVYLTIGNIPKDIRQKPSCRAQILLGYLPTCELENMTNKATRR